MRFPLALTLKMAAYIVGKRLRGKGKFATVLQLEPLHTCNLTCTGCGRIREYSTSLKDVMSLEDCLGAAEECGAPMVSICGGEPLIYPQIEQLIEALLDRDRIVYLCTNALFMRRKMREFLAIRFSESPQTTGRLLGRLLEEGLVSREDADVIRQGNPGNGKPVIRPSKWFYWNVHLDGLAKSHDVIVERKGVFDECILAIRMAKALGFQVATNTTVYRESDVSEIEEMFGLLGELGVDGHTISPGYEYSAAKEDMVKRLNLDPARFFLTRESTREKFRRAQEWGRKYPLLGTPIYLEFLAGLRELTCAAWAIPTRNIRGWKAPCYFLTDGHYASYRELLEQTDWAAYGVVDGVARDPRCANCMTHCGYEPSATLGLNAKRGDLWKTIKFNFGSKPQTLPRKNAMPAMNGLSAIEKKQTMRK